MLAQFFLLDNIIYTTNIIAIIRQRRRKTLPTVPQHEKLFCCRGMPFDTSDHMTPIYIHKFVYTEDMARSGNDETE
jgi:hypothetical protein